MTISFKHLSEQITTDTSWFKNYTNIENKNISVLMLCILYHNAKISRESFTARMNDYRKVDAKGVCLLARVVGTYKSKVLNEWYEGVCITAVLVDEARSCVNVDLSVEEYLKYLNIGFNRNVNYCVDYLAFSIFKPMLDHYDASWLYSFLTSCDIDGLNVTYLSYEQADRLHDLGGGHCCDDCDGDYQTYKLNRYNYYYRNDDRKALGESIRKAFLVYKSHTRNPEDKLLHHWD